MASDFTFKHIIVTAPTVETASVYARQLKSLTNSVIKQSSVHCVPDPIGIRIGSGGGTLNGMSIRAFNNISR